MEEIIKKDLNASQQEAVLNTEGATLVIAGAGSGKTRVLTYRIAYMLSKKTDPSGILSLTFTNKAAREMKDRIQSLVGEKNAVNIWMGTFHSVFARILRKEASALGFTPYFTIYDQTDSKNRIKKIIKDMNLDSKQYPAKEIQSRISKAKNNLMTFQAYRQNTGLIDSDRKRKQGELVNIYEKYARGCRNDNVMDFDDLLLYTNILFKKNPEILKIYQNRFSHILVDEYQDTNYAQYLILKRLAESHKNICVVGDDSQSIYAFRGAKIENIFNFRSDYPDYKLIKLEKNYRSTNSIVEASNSLISKNENRLEKKIFSAKKGGKLIKIFGASSDSEEAFYISDRVREIHEDSNKPYEEFAVLYRTNAQSRQIEEALRKQNIPYYIYAGLSFYQRKEIKDIIAYFRLIVNTNDYEALKRVINYPSRKIGAKTIEKIEKYAISQDKKPWDVIDNIFNENVDLNSPIKNKIKNFAALINEIREQIDSLNALEIADRIIKSSGVYAELKKDKTPEGESRFENMQELINGIQDYMDQQLHENPNSFIKLTDYLENVSLLTTQDTAPKDEDPGVSLMTIHASKGLEFDVIFIAGAEEDLFPGKMSTFSRFDLEEERRLFYVAMTRAREQLFITHAHSRYRFGTMVFNDPSRFIDDISEEYVEITEAEKNNSKDPFDTMFDDKPNNDHKTEKRKTVTKKPKHSQRLKLIKSEKSSSSSSPAAENSYSSDIKEGQYVSHARFGNGTVISIQGEGAEKKATVLFEKEGEKKLLLKFARLKIL